MRFQVKNLLQTLAIRFLRNRGFVVFYLDKDQQHCNADCWLRIYDSVMRTGEKNA